MAGMTKEGAMAFLSRLDDLNPIHDELLYWLAAYHARALGRSDWDNVAAFGLACMNLEAWRGWPGLAAN